MHTSLHWIVFNVFVVVAVALDLGVFHRKTHKILLREALWWSFAWVGLAVTFGLALLHFYGRQPALEFFTGYVIEKALSLDNLFVFLVVFRAFAVKDEYQQRVLGYGILGALLLRGAMIAAGAALIARFSWIMYVFGAFIVVAGAHMLVVRHAESDPAKNFLVRYFSKHLRLTKEYRGANFFVRENGQLFATPAFSGAAGGGNYRRHIRGGFHTRSIWYHARSLHRIYIQRVRDSRITGPLFSPGCGA